MELVPQFIWPQWSLHVQCWCLCLCDAGIRNCHMKSAILWNWPFNFASCARCKSDKWLPTKVSIICFEKYAGSHFKVPKKSSWRKTNFWQDLWRIVEGLFVSWWRCWWRGSERASCNDWRKNCWCSKKGIWSQRSNQKPWKRTQQSQRQNLRVAGVERELTKKIQEIEEERNGLQKYDKAFADKIRAIIPDKNDDERAAIVERDAHLSNDIRGIFPNNSDNEIPGFIRKDGELSSSIRCFFRNGDDIWIKDLIEDNHNLIPELKNQITNLEDERNYLQARLNELENERNNFKVRLNELENEHNYLQGRLNDTENKNHNLSDRVVQLEPEKEFADRVRKELKEDNDENCLNRIIKNRDLINTIGSLFSKV